jgi:hypothetical protein
MFGIMLTLKVRKEHPIGVAGQAILRFVIIHPKKD